MMTSRRGALTGEDLVVELEISRRERRLGGEAPRWAPRFASVHVREAESQRGCEAADGLRVAAADEANRVYLGSGAYRQRW